MKTKIIAFTTAALVFAAGGVAQAQTASVVSKDSRGNATEVSVEGKTYKVCRKGMQDDCINPRAAGLKWGNRPLDYWPGKPASEMKSM